MKKFILSYVRILLIFLATFTTTYAFGQELNSSVHKELSFSEYFFSFCCFIIIVPFLIEGVKSLMPPQKSGANVCISWFIGMLVALFSFSFDIGIFEHFSLIQSLAVGFGATLASNGVFDSGIITSTLKFLNIYSTEK